MKSDSPQPGFSTRCIDAGISDGLVRVSVRIEDVGDLLADFDQALPSA